jgi:uncharacterized protein (TIGR02246 family)
MSAQTLEELAARIRRLEDRAQIEDLLVRYSIACDLRNFEALAECFAEDGSFRAVAGKVTGRPALIAYYTERFEQYGPTFHIPHTVAIDFVDDDHATGTVLAHSEIMMADGMFLSGHHYVDEYVRCADDRWRLESRDNNFFYGLPMTELATMDWREPRRRWPGVDPVKADVPERSASWQAFVDQTGTKLLPDANL